MTIDEKTKAYWEVSSCWNGRKKGKPYTVQEALQKLRLVTVETDPRRPVATLALGLADAIINKPDKKAASGS
ncbi:MAG: hypothetical protein AB7L09_21280 [Nitrospira sp.]